MVPILYYGAPGIGKTAVTRTKYDYVEVLLLSSATEEDIAGLPYREGDKERRTTPPFVERLRARPKNESICLFLDEIDKARREVADTLLTLITHPEHFGLPERVQIVAAANPPEWGGGDGLSQAMLSRFSVIEFRADIEAWAKFMRGKYKNQLVEQVVEGVLSNRVPLLEVNGEGFDWRLSCPRTWDLAVGALIADEPDEVIYGLLTHNCASFLCGLRPRTLKSEDMELHKVQRVARDVGSKQIINKPLRITYE